MKNCTHNNIYKIRNQRSDASFEYFVHCQDCHQWVGKINWDGKFRWLDSILRSNDSLNFNPSLILKENQSQGIHPIHSTHYIRKIKWSS